MKITKLALEAGKKNKNGRIYSAESLKKITNDFSKRISPMFGELGHPESMDVSLTNASHVVGKVFTKCKVPRKKKKFLKNKDLYKEYAFNNSKLYASLNILKTVKGKDAKRMIKSLAIGARGQGTINSDGVIKNYKLLTFDLISK